MRTRYHNKSPHSRAFIISICLPSMGRLGRALFHRIFHRVTDDLAVELFGVGGFADDLVQIFDLHAVLRHRVAVTDGHATVFLRVVIDGDTERRTHCILTAVTLTDRVFLVVRYLEIELQLVHDLAGFLGQTVFLDERHDTCLHRC